MEGFGIAQKKPRIKIQNFFSFEHHAYEFFKKSKTFFEINKSVTFWTQK